MRAARLLIATATLAITALFVGDITKANVDNEVSIEMMDSCKNVSFVVWNVGSGPVEMKKVKYYNKHDGKWRTEDVQNTNCPVNQQCTFGWDNIQKAEGEELTKIVFIFKDKKTGTTFESRDFIPESPRCVRDKTYGFGMHWEIKAAEPEKEPKDLKGDCKQVTFKFTNGTGKYMRITKVKYYNSTKGKWKTEDIFWNSETSSCPPKEHCVTWDGALQILPATQDLLSGEMVPPVMAGADNPGSTLAGANGDNITKIIFVYKTSVDSQKGFSGAQAKESQVFKPIEPRCTEKKQYGNGQAWTIGGK